VLICWISLLTRRLYRKELGLDPSSTLSLVRKWGPSTRNIIRSIKRALLKQPDPIAEEVETALRNLPSQGFFLSILNDSSVSCVVFCRPLRGDKGVQWGAKHHFIPTPHLIEVLRKAYTIQQSLDLFFALSSRALRAGFVHENSMHSRLTSGGYALSIFQGTTENPITQKEMKPSSRLLPGTLTALKQADVTDSFYWMPSVANFDGVDGVLGDEDGNVYTVQATIATEHKGPEKGIKKVWDKVHPDVRTGRTWHYVIVTDNRQAADAYVKEWSKKLRNFKLGLATHVQVWGCVLGQLRV